MENFVILNDEKLFDIVGGSGYGCTGSSHQDNKDEKKTMVPKGHYPGWAKIVHSIFTQGSLGCENWSY